MINSQFGLVQIIKIQQRNKLMTEQVPSKKWVDYTDEESSEEQQQQILHKDTSIAQDVPAVHKPKEEKKTYKPTRMEIDNELDKLDELDDNRFDEVWLLMSSQDPQYFEDQIKYLKSIAKKGGNIVSVYPSKTSTAYEAKVYIKIAYDYISKGYDKTDLMKVTVADNNFARRDEAKGRGKKPADYKEGEKKKYVDKETGLEAPPKVKKQESLPLENDRRYSKQQAEKKGEQLANFRSKPSKKETVESKVAESKTTEAVKQEAKQVKVEVKEEPKVEVKQEAKQQVQAKPKETNKGKVQKKKSKGGNNNSNKYKSQNRFEGIQDLD